MIMGLEMAQSSSSQALCSAKIKYCSFFLIMHDVKIAVIGGSGLYHLDNLEIVEEVHPETVNVNGERKGLQGQLT